MAKRLCPICESDDIDFDACHRCHGSAVVPEMQGEGAWAASVYFGCEDCGGMGGIYTCENGHSFEQEPTESESWDRLQDAGSWED